jgi:hypothetical protein
MRVTRATVAFGLSTPLVVLACDSGQQGDVSRSATADGADNPGARYVGADAGTSETPRGDGADADVARPDEPSAVPSSEPSSEPSGTTSTAANDDAGGAGADPSGQGSAAVGAGGAGAGGVAATPSAGPTTPSLDAGTVQGGGGASGQGGSGGSPPAASAACGDGLLEGDLCFTAPLRLTLPDDTAADVAIGQWDGRAGLDLVVANTGDLVFFPGDGAGDFDPAIPMLALRGTQTYPPGAVALGLGQFDSDGALDVVLGQDFKSNPIVAFGVGDGSIDEAAEPEFAEGTADNFFVADVLGSGPSQDFVLASETDLMLVVSTGAHGAEYQEASSEIFAGGGGDAVLAKLGEQQWLVYSKDTSLYRVAVQYSPLSLTLGMPVETPVSGTTTLLDVADFNEDGFDDVVTALDGSAEVDVLLADGMGAGDFAQVAGGERFLPLGLPASSGATDVKTGDFDGDGHADVAASVTAGDAIVVFRGDGSGGFGSPTVLSTGAGSGPGRLAVGDLNGDGVDDIAAIGETVGDVIVLSSDP